MIVLLFITSLFCTISYKLYANEVFLKKFCCFAIIDEIVTIVKELSAFKILSKVRITYLTVINTDH